MMRYLSIFILSVCYHLLLAQNPAHYIIGKDIFDGVHLYSIIQDDADNSMWIASNKGLYHYDGVTFTHQIPEKSKATDFFGLTKNNESNIFCYNLNGQIFKIVNKELQLYFTIPKAYSGVISNIVFDSNNNLFINTRNSELLMVSDEKKITKILKNTTSLLKESDTLFYIKEDFLIKKVGNKEFRKRIKNGEGATAFKINNAFFYFDYNTNQLFKLEKNTFRKVSLSLLENATFILFRTKHLVWFSDYKKGVYVIKKELIDANPKIDSWFSDYFISQVYTDTENNTWLLTFNQGIIIVPNLQNSMILPPNNSDFKSISKTNNQLYIATDNGQIYRLNHQKFKPYFKADKAERLDYMKVFPQKNIIVTSTRLYIGNWSRKNSYCRDAFLLKDSLLLGVSSSLGSCYIKSKKGKTLVRGRIYNIYHDTLTNKTWCAATSGLKQYQNGHIESIKYNNQEILDAKIQPVANQIWVTSKDGIFIFEKDSIVQHLTQKDGLLANDVDNIKYEYPYAYLLYQKGIQQYNIRTQTIKSFTQSNGLTKAITSFEVLNDTVYAINSNGLLTFTFDNNSDSIPAYQTKITKAIANGTNEFTNNTKLLPKENNIEFSFLTTTFRYQKTLRYQYQLIGFDDKPIVAKENRHYINYSNLPAGNYTFKVDSFFGKHQNLPAVLNFTISEFWYNTLWFKLLVLGVLLTMLYIVYKYRINNILRKRDKEEMEKRLAESSLVSLKAQMNPHFLFNAMNSIQTLIISDQKKEAYQYLTQLSNLVRENLQMSNVTFVPFESELKLIEKYLELEKLRFEENFTYCIENNITDNHILIPSMIIQPFVENAIKHGLLHKKNNRKLSLKFEKKQQTIECVVVDNGIGRRASQDLQEKKNYISFSTNAIQKRFSILQEYYQMDVGFVYEDLHENNQPSGTKVTIKIPIKNEFEEK